MKYFIFITLLILVHNSQQRTFEEYTQMWNANMLKHHDKCLKESGADSKLAFRVLSHGEFVDDYKLKCHMRCVLENFMLIHPDNSIHHSGFLDLLYVDERKMLEETDIAEKCLTIKLDDPCESAYRTCECIYRLIQSAMNEVEPKAQ